MSAQGWGKAARAAAEGSGFAIPGMVGSVGLLYFKLGADYVAPALMATMLGVMLMLLVTSRNGRPMMYSVRVLEVTTLASFLDQFVLKMPGWNLADTPEHRLLLLVAACVGMALLLPLFYLLGLQRFARMMPAPVFAGFSSAVGVSLLVSQTRVLWQGLPVDGVWAVLVAATVLATALATRRWWRGLPAGVMGVAAGTCISLLLGALGVHALATVTAGTASLVLPVTLLSPGDLLAPGVRTLAILQDVLIASLTLTCVVFLNTVVAEETLTQVDDRVPHGPVDNARKCGAQLAAALLGSAPLTPVVASSRAAVEAGGLNGRTLVAAAGCVLLVAGSNVLQLVALAAIVGLLLFDAITSFDQASLRQMRDWVLRRPLETAQKEDLATVVWVILAVALVNMVAGVFVGMFAGLLLYALRNGKRLARTVTDGNVARSHCQRSRADAQLLATHASQIRYLELEGALFFGAVTGLQKQVREQAGRGHYLVVDWSYVLSTDSTVASAFAKLAYEIHASGGFVAVSGMDAAGAGVRETLVRAGMAARVFPDADRALEWAENQIIARHAGQGGQEGTLMIDALALFQGIAGEDRAALEAVFMQKFFRSGETVFSAGDASDDLMVIMQGSANIVVTHDSGRDLRLACIRRGAMLGELSFLDASPRSASAIAAEDLLVGVLSRARFDVFAAEWPLAAQQMLSNLAVDLSSRLRRTNRMTLGRLRPGEVRQPAAG